ncbi:MAG TPA: SsrA-binding protein, partial [Candidatus Paceibacterota bacterium]
NLAGSYAILRAGEVWLLGADIPPYQPRNAPQDYDSQRTRKLLLTEKEIKSLAGEIKGTGLTLVPLRAYIKGRLVKIELGLGKGKKKADKRELIKKRETEREMRRTLRK